MYQINDGNGVINIECKQVFFEKIRCMMKGYFELTESKDLIKDDVFEITIKEFPQYIDFGKFNKSIKLHCDKKGYLREGNSIQIYNVVNNYLINIEDNKKIYVYGNCNEINFMYECIRLIRICFEINLLINGFVKLHMCVMKNKENTVGIIGEKGAGKTTMLLELARRGFEICTNDKAFVNTNGLCYGVCQRLGLLEYSMIKYGISKEGGEFIGNKYYFWPIEIAKKTDGSICSCCTLDKIILVNYKRWKEISIEAIENFDEKKAILKQSVLKFSDKCSMEAIRDLIMKQNKFADKNVTLENEFICNLPWFRITGEFEQISRK